MEREQLTLRLPEELKEALQKEAQEKGISLNSLIIALLRSGADHEKLRSS